MKTISIYATGDRDTISRYRIWQYYDNIEDATIIAHSKYSPFLLNHYAPIGQQNLLIKLIAWVNMCCRCISFLMLDFIKEPDCIVIQRELVKKNTPFVANVLLKQIHKRGTKVIWDFDDQILAMKEINEKDFSILAECSDHITVTHEYLKSLVPQVHQTKVVLLPTTDGEMFKTYEDHQVSITNSRLETLKSKLIVAWVATKGNLPYLVDVIPALDQASKELSKRGINMILKVICNGPLEHNVDSLSIENIPWSKETALKGLLSAHVGIMPLRDTVVAKGKGGFKLVQYMSVGLPCVTSSVGFNKDVVDQSFGFFADCEKDWVGAFIKLSDPDIWSKCSMKAFEHWTQKFSYDNNLKTIETLMK